MWSYRRLVSSLAEGSGGDEVCSMRTAPRGEAHSGIALIRFRVEALAREACPPGVDCWGKALFRLKV
jgi:hypothetical protein